jgi:hypothetical protein
MSRTLQLTCSDQKFQLETIVDSCESCGKFFKKKFQLKDHKFATLSNLHKIYKNGKHYIRSEANDSLFAQTSCRPGEN